MDKKVYYAHSGWISGGPSREAMFDSLRLGKIIDVQFVMTDREIVNRRAVVTSVKKVNPANFNESDEWYIELLFEGKYKDKASPKDIKFFWSGSYSTRHREGKLIGDLPVCLICK